MRRLKYGMVDSDNVLHSSQALSFPDVHISDLLHDKLQEHGDKILMIDGRGGQKFSARQLMQMSSKIACGLVHMDVREGDIIFCACPDSVLSAIIILAIHFTGAVYSGSYWTVPRPDMQFQVETVRAKVLICASHNLDDIMAAADAVPSVTSVLCVDSTDAETTPNGKKVVSIQSFLQKPINARIKIPVKIDKKPEDALCCIMFSSGSTGMPKGVVVSHANATAQCYAHMAIRDQRDSIEAGTVGFAHTVGLTMIRLIVLTGTTVVVQDNFQLEAFLKTVQEYKCTSAWLSPSELTQLTKSPLLDQYDVSSLHEIKVGGATIAVPVMQAFYARTSNRTKITGVYGLTECGDVSHVPLPEMDGQTVGALLPGLHLKVVACSGGCESVAPGVAGEILVKGPQLTAGYYERPEATCDNFTPDGWFRSGDMGLVSGETGLLHIIARLKDVIKGDGEQVAPAELESLLLAHESVAEAAVIGIPDEGHCEVPLAFVVLKAGHEKRANKQQILQTVNCQVADYKQIRGGIDFVPSLPKISIGKVDRMALRRRWKSASADSVTV